MQKILELIFSLLENSLRFLFEFIEIIFGQISKKKGYHAEFASQRTLLSSDYSGFCLTGKNLSIKNSFQNAMVIGGTGVGKSSVVLINSCFTMQSSLIIHDPSGELFTKTAGYLKQKGYEIKRLHFADPSVSDGYNPLFRTNTSSEIQKVASLIIDTALGGKTKDPFWNTQAIGLLTMLITILKKQEPQFQNFFNLRQLLNQLGSNPEVIDNIFSHYADTILFAEYKSFLAYDEKVVSSVIATCKAALQLFADDSVAKVTSHDTIDMQEFRSKPVALFINNSVGDCKYYSILTSLYFEQFFSFVLSRFPSEKEQAIFFLIDEASSLNLPTLPLAVANVRKNRSGIMLLLQSFDQLIFQYGKYNADGIKSNCFTKMYFTGQSLETTKELEQTLGHYEYQDDKKNKVIRPLMTSDEIRTMDISKALLVCGSHRPIIARLKPYYKNSSFLKNSLIPPPETRTPRDFSSIPVLRFNSKVKTDE